jgi:DNA-binding MarR family transcriptional regulator
MEKQESIGKWVSTLSRHLRIYLDKEFEQYDISSGQIHVYMTLLNNDGINQEALANQLNLDKATISRAVEKLIKEGYVTRETNPEDHRAYNLHMTKKGKDIESEIRNSLRKVTVILLSDFKADEKEIALKLLKRMHKNLLSAETIETNNS